MNKRLTPYGTDLDYLQRCKNSTPEQRLDWLNAAQEFVRGVEKARGKEKKTRNDARSS